MSTDDKLSKVFDVDPIKVDEKNIEIMPREVGHSISPSNETFEYDYNATRNNLHALLQQGQDALVHALEVAKQSEHPRAFEVVSGLMKDLADINGKLLDLHKKKQIIENPKTPESKDTKQVTNNNAIFVGSTTELSKMLDDMRKGK